VGYQFSHLIGWEVSQFNVAVTVIGQTGGMFSALLVLVSWFAAPDLKDQHSGVPRFYHCFCHMSSDGGFKQVSLAAVYGLGGLNGIAIISLVQCFATYLFTKVCLLACVLFWIVAKFWQHT